MNTRSIIGISICLLAAAISRSQPANDNFTNAKVIMGNNFDTLISSIDAATMEPGEPAHMGSVAQKSVWWKWQAPGWGSFYINSEASLATNHEIAVYTGDSLDTLTLVGKSTDILLFFQVAASQTYYFAGATPTNATGDIRIRGAYGIRDYSSHPVSGNLLLEPSWESTGLEPAHWGMIGAIGGYVNEQGGADGVTWPVLCWNEGVYPRIWQDFTTIHGHQYAIRFAFQVGGQLSNGGGDAQVGVMWDGNQLGVASFPESEGGFWHWTNYLAVASNTTSRILFTNMARCLEMDAFSVVDVTAPPTIAVQPQSISSIAGGSAAFSVRANGSFPLCYQWLFNDSPLAGRTNRILEFSPVTTNHMGNYRVVITNNYGAVTSAVASLLVDSPVAATILSQPYGDTIPAGGYFNFGVIASGTAPLTYQWFFGGQPITGATNDHLTLASVQATNAGTYFVQVQNSFSSAQSLPANLVVTTTNIGGGTIFFWNKNILTGPVTNNAPVYDFDGLTLLSGSNYVAQLYAGPSLAALRPAGQPTSFQSGLDAGYFMWQIITLANVAPHSNAVLQVCAWDASYGNSYEQARARGGRFGKSEILQVTAGGDGQPPRQMEGLESFSLHGGLPYFEVGTITFVQRQSSNTMVWALHGQPGSIYLIEKSKHSEETVWRPFTVVTNVTGTVEFTDTADSGAANVWYRARILN